MRASCVKPLRFFGSRCRRVVGGVSHSWTGADGEAAAAAQKQNVNGIKIQVSGRLNGAEIARSEWIREGRVPLQTLRADIDYATQEANTIYGVLGIKVWLFKSEILSK